LLAVALAVTAPSNVALAGDICDILDPANCRPAHETATALVGQQVNSLHPAGVGGANNRALATPLLLFWQSAGVEKPDGWPCSKVVVSNDVMPQALVDANSRILGPLTLSSWIGSLPHTQFVMICNWTHFASNPAFPGFAAPDTEQIVRKWAYQITDDIKAQP